MQSTLKNPLASSFTLGVSAGASLGAAIVILGAGSGFAAVASLAGFPLAVPAAGFLFGFATILAVSRFSRAIDPSFSGNTVVLAGMVFSLLVNAVQTMLSAIAREGLNRLVFWQMGSFALKGWTPIAIVAPILAACLAAIMRRARELDIITFSDDEATSLGVPVARTRRTMILLSTALSGTVVAFVGVIGFIDLVVPHAARRLVGPAHGRLIPVSALAGGALMVLADLAARALFPPTDLPVGAVTAIIGAPFFALVFFSARKEAA